MDGAGTFVDIVEAFAPFAADVRAMAAELAALIADPLPGDEP